MAENSLLIVPNLTLSFVLVLQMVFTAALCMFVVLDTNPTTATAYTTANDDSFEYLSTATWMLSSWNFLWLCPTLLTLFSVFWIAMHVGLKLSTTTAPISDSSCCAWRLLQKSAYGKPRKIQIMIAVSYICFSVVIAMFFARASAEAVCDPLVRLVTFSHIPENNNNTKTNNNNNNANQQYDGQMLPLSEVPFAGPDWIGETTPPPKGGSPCVAYTQYAQNGQSLVIVALCVCIIAFIVSNAGAWLRPLSLASAKMAVFQCILVVSILGCSAQVVLNNDSWDWRVVNSLLTAFGASAYLAACVTTLDASKRGDCCHDDPSVWERAAWIYVQLLLACEEAALRLTENS